MAAKKRSRKSTTTEHTGRVSAYAGKKLFKVKGKMYPAREGSQLAESFALIRDGISYEKYRLVGGDRRHLANLIRDGYVRVKKVVAGKSKPKAAAKVATAEAVA